MKTLSEYLIESINSNKIKPGSVFRLLNGEYAWIEVKSLYFLEDHRILSNGTSDKIDKALADRKNPVYKDFDGWLLFPVGAEFKYVKTKDDYMIFDYIQNGSKQFEVAMEEYEFEYFCKNVEFVK